MVNRIEKLRSSYRQTNLELQALSSAEEYTKEYLTVTESIKIYIKSAKESKKRLTTDIAESANA